MTDTVVIRGSSEATVVVESGQIQVVDVAFKGQRVRREQAFQQLISAQVR